MSEALFDPATPEPLRLPGDLSAGTGPVKYETYKAKHLHRCDDCVLVLYEANRKNEAAPPPRQARFSRIQQGSQKLLVCAEHKNLREIQEQGRTGQLRAV